MQIYYSAMPQSSPNTVTSISPRSLTVPISLRGPKKTLIFLEVFKPETRPWNWNKPKIRDSAAKVETWRHTTETLQAASQFYLPRGSFAESKSLLKLWGSSLWLEEQCPVWAQTAYHYAAPTGPPRTSCVRGCQLKVAATESNLHLARGYIQPLLRGHSAELLRMPVKERDVKPSGQHLLMRK